MPLLVYGITESANKISGFVESEEGRSFTIHVHDLRISSVSSGGYGWEISTFLDGSK